MIKYNNRGKHTSQNLVDYLLSFNTTSTWSTVGVGTSSVVLTDYFDGTGCLKINNTEYSNTNLVASNATQSTVIDRDGTYDFSMYLKKSLEQDMGVKVEIFKNAASVYSDEFVFSEDDVNNWTSFITNENFSFVKADVITFIFTLLSDETSTIEDVSLFVDGLHLYNKERNQLEAPIYVAPVEESETIDNQLKNEKGFGFYVDSLTTPTITIGTSWTELVIDALGANVTNSLPLDIRGVSELIDSGIIQPIASGDDYGGRLDITVDSKTGSPNYLEVIIDFAGSTPDTLRAFTGYIQQGKTPPFRQSLALDFFTGDTFLANGGKIYARTDSGSWTISTRNIKISRISKIYN
ncbi:hypothetical protein Harreka1_12 [Olleya phage Harreka_1]|uniref:Uncharacterized protein n=1 Tax=Olleya phage Harreka_1 TaxID=2745673 RepID=A0A8E4ZF94_9CAUD|nr:hypothetical protein M1M26_gp12 [Olleya phage Harreka_1]QQV90419.1 hypothetical protein Harreka1_12 [Olleya phage Harreka_1]